MKLTIDKNWKIGDIIDVRGLMCTIMSKTKIGSRKWEYELRRN